MFSIIFDLISFASLVILVLFLEYWFLHLGMEFLVVRNYLTIVSYTAMFFDRSFTMELGVVFVFNLGFYILFSGKTASE